MFSRYARFKVVIGIDGAGIPGIAPWMLIDARLAFDPHRLLLSPTMLHLGVVLVLIVLLTGLG